MEFLNQILDFVKENPDAVSVVADIGQNLLMAAFGGMSAGFVYMVKGRHDSKKTKSEIVSVDLNNEKVSIDNRYEERKIKADTAKAEYEAMAAKAIAEKAEYEKRTAKAIAEKAEIETEKTREIINVENKKAKAEARKLNAEAKKIEKDL